MRVSWPICVFSVLILSAFVNQVFQHLRLLAINPDVLDQWTVSTRKSPIFAVIESQPFELGVSITPSDGPRRTAAHAFQEFFQKKALTRSLKNRSSTTRPCMAAVVPFRGRWRHLQQFYDLMAKFLSSPEGNQMCMTFYIVEQFDTDLFNRGWLFNVGFSMATTSQREFACVSIHDVDTLPEVGAGVDYGQCKVPTQLSSEIQCYNWLPPYAFNAGGVVNMAPEHWKAINGFSNDYVGWGGEDDDLYVRLAQMKLLRGTCGAFCEHSELGFRLGQKGLINRPPRGKGRFLCLDESSHTPRVHGDEHKSQRLLQEMHAGSMRWVFDGLSSLAFDIVSHETRPFPGIDRDSVELNWVKVVGKARSRFSPWRIRLVLAPEVCSSTCRAAHRCSASPTRLPFNVTQLKREFVQVLGDCFEGVVADALGFWVMDRHLLLEPVWSVSGTGAVGGAGAAEPGRDEASWALSEAIREALSSMTDSETALTIRAVRVATLTESLVAMRRDGGRQQVPVIPACAGVYQLRDERLGTKHTVALGSADCGQRSWTHLASFGVLRAPRTPADVPICVGEAVGLWTTRVARRKDCSGVELGVTWRHRFVFYLGSGARGPTMCVRHIEESGELKNWSRWQVVPLDDEGECRPGIPYSRLGHMLRADTSFEGRQLIEKLAVTPIDRIESALPERVTEALLDDGYTTDFTFRSMVDDYVPSRTLLCVFEGHVGRLSLELDCPEPQRAALTVAVLRWDNRTVAVRAANEADISVFCVGRDTLGDFIAKATGQKWCVASCGDRQQVGREDCSAGGCSKAFEFREVALEDVGEALGVLRAPSV